jgi:hypothetical protein
MGSVVKKQVVSQEVKKFPALYGIQMFIISLKKPESGSYHEPEKFTSH